MITASIAGGSGYSGGELIRFLHFHPEVAITQVTSERLAGRFVHNAHPNLRRVSRLTFCALSELEPCDLLFLCLPHGEAMQRIDTLRTLAPRVIDLSGDFRLSDAASYAKRYGRAHTRPELLGECVYGIPELHREELAGATFAAGAGCNATVTILALPAPTSTVSPGSGSRASVTPTRRWPRRSPLRRARSSPAPAFSTTPCGRG